MERLGEKWLGEKKAKLEFKACSGAQTDGMMDQMDQTTRPKVTLMEVGGNNANFYPMADACLFHSERGTDYGPHFDDDNPNDPKGKCWKEIHEVQTRIGNNKIREKIVGVINGWRGHRANMGNDASLYAHGYPWFFGDNKECDEYTFTVPYANDKTQMVTQGLREKMNSLVRMPMALLASI